MSSDPIELDPRLYEHYAGRRVVVLGGAGFVGGWLRSILSTKINADVLTIDNLTRGKSSSRKLPYEGEEYIADVRDYVWLADALSGADFVFNLAASVAGVLHNQSHHVEMYKENIDVLTNPVLAAGLAGVRAFLQTSSVCVYSPENNSPSREEYGLDGVPHPANAGYAEAKRDGERVAGWSNIPRVIIVRPSNVAGYGDYFDDKAHVIPAFIKRAYEMKKQEKDKFVLYGDPAITREFIHPADVAVGMLTALALGRNRQAYNIGTFGMTTTRMDQLAYRVLAKFGAADSELVIDGAVGGGDEKRWSSGSKMLTKTGWSAQFNLDTIIDEAVADYTGNWIKRG